MARRYKYLTLVKIEALDGSVEYAVLPGKQRKRSAWVKPYVVGFVTPIEVYKLPRRMTLSEIDMYLATPRGKRIMNQLKALKGRGGDEGQKS